MIKLKFSLHNSSSNDNFGLTVCIQPNIALLVASTGKFIDKHLRDEQAQSRNLTFILGVLMRNLGLQFPTRIRLLSVT
jgi:hypothetical protein